MDNNINSSLSNSNNSSRYIQQLIDEKILDSEASPSVSLSVPPHQIKPDPEFVEFLTKSHPVYTRNKEQVGNLKISLLDLYESTSDSDEPWFLVGSSVLSALGVNGVLTLLSIIKVGNRSLREILPSSIDDFIQWRCSRKGNDSDFRIKKKHDLKELSTFFAQKTSNHYDTGWLIKNFYITRYRKEDKSWCIHGFYYGKSKRAVQVMQVMQDPSRSSIFKESAIKLQILDKGNFVKLVVNKDENLASCFLQQLFGVLQISSKGIREKKDVCMLLARESHFMHTRRAFEEEELLKLVEESFEVVELLKKAFKDHSNGSFSAFVTLLLNALRLWPKEEKLLVQEFLKEEEILKIAHCSKNMLLNTLFEMLKKGISAAQISAFMQVLASLKLLKASELFHSTGPHLLIGEEHSILLKKDFKTAHLLFFEHYNLLLPYISKFYNSDFRGLWVDHICKTEGIILEIPSSFKEEERVQWYLACLATRAQAYQPLLKELEKCLNSKKVKQMMPLSLFDQLEGFVDPLAAYKVLLRRRLMEITIDINDVWKRLFEYEKQKFLSSHKEQGILLFSYRFCKEEYSFHRSQSLTLTAIGELALRLFNELKEKHNIEAKELRNLFKNEPAIQNQMQLPEVKKELPKVEIKKIENITPKIPQKKKETFSLQSLKELLAQKGGQKQLIEKDQAIADLIKNSSVEELLSLELKKLKDHLPKLPKTQKAFNEYVLQLKIENKSEIEIIYCSSHSKKILFEKSLELLKEKPQEALSLFENMLKCPAEEKLQKDFTPFVMALRDGKTGVWLYGLKNGAKLRKSFVCVSEALFDIRLDQCDQNTYKEIYSCLTFFEGGNVFNLKKQLLLVLKDKKLIAEEVESLQKTTKWTAERAFYFLEVLQQFQPTSLKQKELIFSILTKLYVHLHSSAHLRLLISLLLGFNVPTIEEFSPVFEKLLSVKSEQKENEPFNKQLVAYLRKKTVEELRKEKSTSVHKILDWICSPEFSTVIPLNDKEFFDFFSEFFDSFAFVILNGSGKMLSLYTVYFERVESLGGDEQSEEPLLLGFSEMVKKIIYVPEIKNMLFEANEFSPVEDMKKRPMETVLCQYYRCKELYLKKSTKKDARFVLWNFLLNAIEVEIKSYFCCGRTQEREQVGKISGNSYTFLLVESRFLYQESIEKKLLKLGLVQFYYRIALLNLHFTEGAHLDLQEHLQQFAHLALEDEKEREFKIALLLLEGFKKLTYCKKKDYSEEDLKKATKEEKTRGCWRVVRDLGRNPLVKSKTCTINIFKHYAEDLRRDPEWLKKMEEILYEGVVRGEDLVLLGEQWADYGYKLFQEKEREIGYSVILSSVKYRKHIVDRCIELDEKLKFSGLIGVIRSLFSFFLDQDRLFNQLLDNFQPLYQKDFAQLIKNKLAVHGYFESNQTRWQFLELLEENWKVLLYIFEKLKGEETKKFVKDYEHIFVVFVSVMLSYTVDYCKETKQDIKIFYEKFDSLLLLFNSFPNLKEFYIKIKRSVQETKEKYGIF